MKEKNNNIFKFFKVIIAIFMIVLLIIVTMNLFPIIKNLSTKDGQIEFKNKISNSGVGGLCVLFGLEIAQIFLFILPGEPLEILAGMCYGTIGGTVFILISACIISTVIFFLVRKLGKKFVYEFCDEEKAKKILESKIFQNPKKVEMILLILFLIPGTPKDLLVYVSGLLPVKPLRFILISTFARIPSVVSSTIAGANLAAGNWKFAILLYLIIVVAIIVIIYIVNKFDKDKTTEEAMKSLRKN